jgi:hypothetical protein
MPSSCNRGLVRAAVVLVALSFNVLPSGFIHGAAAATPDCADVLIVGARGSGEPGPGRPGWQPTPEDPYGLGPTVLSAVEQITGRLAGHRSTRVVAISYPAKAVLTPDILRKPDEYFVGLGQGVDAATSVLDGRVTCTQERVVLVGYSQGAMLMHRALRRLDASPSRRSILDRVDAVLLVGDGDRVTGDRITEIGTMHPSRKGIGLLWPSQSGSSAAKLPGTVGERVFGVCLRDDPVCDAPSIKLLIHDDYTGIAKSHLTKGSTQVAQRVLVRPLVKPDAITVPFAAGSPLRYQLTADVDPRRTLQWAVESNFLLPGGLTLSKSGLLSGTPTGVTFGPTRVRVRSVAGKEVSSWVDATITWRQADVGLTIFRPNGPAGFTSHVTGIVCPAPVNGTMYVIGQGAAQNDIGWYKTYRAPVDMISVVASYSAKPGTYPAFVACAEGSDPINWTTLRTVKRYDFAQTVATTRPKVKMPKTAMPGSTIVITDGGGCGTYTRTPQQVRIVVDGLPKPVTAPVDPAGHWGPLSITLPQNAASKWELDLTCRSAADGGPDYSMYYYGWFTIRAS